MSEIYREFERQLADWRSRYAGRPEHELLHLCLLALEREENVVVAYDYRVMGPRLAALPVRDDVRDLMQACLARIWLDETMHATYIRSALLGLGKVLLSARTLMQQMTGAIGGWTVAVQQHRRWSDAPLSRAAATLLTWAGGITGRVPAQVRRHIAYSSFRQFCRYNVHTESTAWLCWDRLTELLSQVPALYVGDVETFRRIADDEYRHQQIFNLLGESLDAEDRLARGVSAGQLEDRIAAVGEAFLPQTQPSPAHPDSLSTVRTSTTPQSIERSRLA